MLRTFLALEIGDEARRVAAGWVERLRREPWGDAVRWAPAEALHVTLRFLGATAEDRVASLVTTLRRETAAIAPFTVQRGAVSGFPHPHRPRVVFLGLDDEPAGVLVELAAATERAARAAGFAPETRPFHGHLTLGRRRSSRRPLRLPDGECAEPAPFSADAVVLFRSQRSAAGATYTPLERIALGGVASP
ncbi:RNA 2',3'-cyclic phosphodiesterase [Myxococcota bacterium]|nr:RNA 2',3'-cyclic phosphodiesterase [Myxococcota bacterium]